MLSSYANDIFNRKNFLHSIPNEIESKYKLSALLNECATWGELDKVHFSSRFELAKALVEVLNKIIFSS